MSLEGFERNRGRRAITGFFIIGALIIGFLTLKLIPENLLMHYLVLTISLGVIIGLILIKFFDKKKPIEDWYEPEYRSKEYDSIYRASDNQISDKNYVALFKKFTDSELITSMRLRYYCLTDLTEAELIKEIKDRKISTEYILKHYNDIKYYKYRSTKLCPCCGNSKYVKLDGNKITECMVCGFNREFENPDSLATIIRWTLGIYYASKLHENDFIKLTR